MSGLAELSARVEEVSQLYAARSDIRRDDDWFALKLQEEAGELVAEYLRRSGRGRVGDRNPEQIELALANEAADLFAQLLLFCRHNGIDIEAALERKWFSHLNKQP